MRRTHATYRNNDNSSSHRIMARFSAFAFLAIFTSATSAFMTPLAGAQLGRRAVSANVATTRMSAAPATAAPTVRQAERCSRVREKEPERKHSRGGARIFSPFDLGRLFFPQHPKHENCMGARCAFWVQRERGQLSTMYGRFCLSDQST